VLRPQRLEAAVNRAHEDVLAGDLRGSEILIDDPLGTVMAHGPTLQQVIYNLLSNASKFVHSHQIARIKVSSKRCGDRIVLQLRTTASA
jgi:C4-dicarboxylate-specific signal transduction histidine kinase